MEDKDDDKELNQGIESEDRKVISSNPLETTDNPEMIVRDLEVKHLRRLKMTHLPPQARHILLLAASLHIREGRGLTVDDFQGIGFRKDNAEKKIQDARRNGLLVTLGKEEKESRNNITCQTTSI